MVKRKWDGNLNIKINQVMLLSDVSKKLINEINFNIQLSDINESFVASLLGVVQKYPGKQNLKFSIYDNDVSLNFLSKKYQVKISANLINDMSFMSKEYVLK